MYTHAASIGLPQTDAAGVVFFARYFDLAHVAFEGFMAHIGHPLLPELHASPIAYPLVHVEADYKKPLRMGDEIEIDVTVAKVSAGSFVLHHAFRLVSSRYDPKARPSVVTRITTVHASADVPSKSAVSLAPALSDALKKHVATPSS